MTTPAAPVWKVIGKSVRGASHVRSGSPCQDALAISPGDDNNNPLIVALADGHGSAKCFRSDVGSHLAVDAARRELDKFAISVRSEPDLSNIQKQAIETLPPNIENYWKHLVREHQEVNPFSDAEQALLTEGQEALILPYGATLIALMVTNRFMLQLQLGDGDLIILQHDDTVSTMLPADPLIDGNVTTSLCLPDSRLHFRLLVTPLDGFQPLMVMLSTDGYSNSFDDPKTFHDTIREYHRYVTEKGRVAVEAQLSDWLSATSERGSGDDITLALIWPIGEPPPREQVQAMMPEPSSAPPDPPGRNALQFLSHNPRSLLIGAIVLLGGATAYEGWSLSSQVRRGDWWPWAWQAPSSHQSDCPKYEP